MALVIGSVGIRDLHTSLGPWHAVVLPQVNLRTRGWGAPWREKPRVYRPEMDPQRRPPFYVRAVWLHVVVWI